MIDNSLSLSFEADTESLLSFQSPVIVSFCEYQIQAENRMTFFLYLFIFIIVSIYILQ